MRIRCTACSALLQVPDELAGKRLRCPKCKELTVATPAAVEKPRPPSSAAVRSSSSPPGPKPASKSSPVRSRHRDEIDDDDEDDPPRPKKKKKRKKKAKKDYTSLITGVAVSGGVVVCLAIAVVIYGFTKPANLDGPAKVDPVIPVVAQAPRIGIMPRVEEPKKGDRAVPDDDDDPDPAEKNPAKQPAPPKRPVTPPPPVPPKRDIDTLAIREVPSIFKLPESTDEVWFARRKSELASMQRTLRGAYDQIGKRNPKWDEPARKSLDLVAEVLAETELPATSVRPISEAVEKALKAGCDDPMIRYLGIRLTKRFNAGTIDQAAKAHIAVAEALRDSKYSAYHRSVCLRTVASLLLTAKQPQLDEPGLRLMADAVKAYVVAAKEEASDPGMAVRLMNEGHLLRQVFELTENDLKKGFQVIDDALKPVKEAEGLRQKLMGEFLISYAWDARGGGVANTVTQDGWKLFHERLREAEKCCEAAWGLDAKDPMTAARAITISKGLSLGDASKKKWFDRAMSADPTCRTACEELIDALDPKWSGNRDNLIAFGRECRKSKAIRSRIPLLVAEAHVRAFMFAQEGLLEKYLKQPAVWDEIVAVHAEYFAKYPDDDLVHASYAMYCTLVEKWDLASDHFQRAKGAVPASLIFGVDQYLAARDLAFRNHPPTK